ncbi:hypothetical protein [Aquabacterium sp. J223]|uniref:hypothetical protein n=1 Tax=Aquabacterium sp. J223 TaxID=2898431 RepID=UPI0021AE09FA|nr:hypothetical protein [Aquabacterium sp. J223]UUX94004.1 hypothetical protein LRS07_11620 [Aquabacterium sp. J223]
MDAVLRSGTHRDIHMKHEFEQQTSRGVVDMSRRAGLGKVTALAAALMSHGRVFAPGALGLGGGGVASAALANSCVLSPNGRTGPFYTALNLVRSDLREDKTGVVLDLELTIRNTACSPVVGAAVAVWSCDSRGMYSEYPNVNPDVPGYTQVPLGQVPPEAPHYPEQTLAQHFLRGVQVTDAMGCARFRMLYPSWYATRTPHVHVKVYPGAAVGDTASYTGQLYFPEAINSVVLSSPLYTGRTAARDTMNNTDRHYVAMGGLQNELHLTSMPTGFHSSKQLVIPV